MLIHTAYTDDLKITAETPNWIFDQCVFFTEARVDFDDAESVQDVIGSAYAQGDAKHVYALRTSGDLIDVSRLCLDDEAAEEIQRLWGDTYYDDEQFEDVEIDAEGLLDGTDLRAENAIEDGGFHIQRIRAQAAKRQGYLGVVDHDEQGEVIIIDFADRNDDLNACWQYMGKKQ